MKPHRQSSLVKLILNLGEVLGSKPLLCPSSPVQCLKRHGTVGTRDSAASTLSQEVLKVSPVWVDLTGKTRETFPPYMPHSQHPPLQTPSLEALRGLSTARCSSDSCSATSHTICSHSRRWKSLDKELAHPRWVSSAPCSIRNAHSPWGQGSNSSHRAEILCAWGPVENTRGDKTATNGFGISASHGSPWLDPKSVDVLCMKQSSSKFLQYPGLIWWIASYTVSHCNT